MWKFPTHPHNIHTPISDNTKKLSIQEKNAEVFPNLHSSLILFGKLCDKKSIVTFDKKN